MRRPWRCSGRCGGRGASALAAPREELPPAIERAGEFGCGLVAVERVFLHAAPDDVLDGIGEVAQRAHGEGGGTMLEERVHRRLALERRAAREHGVEGDASRVDVGTMVHVTIDLFRGREGRGTNEAAGDRDAGGGRRPGDTKIRHLGATARVQEHVFRLDVAVDDATGAGLFECARNLTTNAERFFGR
ncbi:MAG: hypothetical protein R3B97_16580 [Dehalococcoidia bacterium]